MISIAMCIFIKIEHLNSSCYVKSIFLWRTSNIFISNQIRVKMKFFAIQTQIDIGTSFVAYSINQLAIRETISYILYIPNWNMSMEHILS